MRLAVIFLAVYLLLVGVVVADGCGIQDLCYDQDGSPFCAPDAVACTFRMHTLVDGRCVAADEVDGDGDGWSTTCDAFPTNVGEWMDLDGDGTGHNADCDDLDPAVTDCLAAIGSFNETIPGDTGSSDGDVGSGAGSSDGDVGSGAGSSDERDETDNRRNHHVNNNVGIVKLVMLAPENGSSSDEEVVIGALMTAEGSGSSPSDDAPSYSARLIPRADETDDNRITGNVVGSLSDAGTFGWVLLALIFCLILLNIIVRLRR